MRKTGTHAFDNGFLGGKAHGDESHRPRRTLELLPLLRHQQVRQEALAMLLVDALDAIDLAAKTEIAVAMAEAEAAPWPEAAAAYTDIQDTGAGQWR